MTAKSVTVYHPSIAGVEQDVPADSVSEWADAGWRKAKPKAVELSAAEKAEAKQAAQVLADVNAPVTIVTEA